MRESFEKVSNHELSEQTELNPQDTYDVMSGQIVHNLQGGGAGEYLRYDPLYDEVREARSYEDSRLSQGVWQRDLKQADSLRVEELCVGALREKTKDLQLVLWLVEAWGVRDGLRGFCGGLTLLNTFVQKYCESMYPLDLEHRQRIFEWMDGTFSMRLYMWPFAKGEAKTYAFHDIVVAKNFDTVLRRDPTQSAKQIERAHKRGDPLLPHVTAALHQTPIELMQQYALNLKNIEELLRTFHGFLAQKMGKESPAFSQLFTTISGMERLIQMEVIRPYEKKISSKKSSTSLEEASISPESVEISLGESLQKNSEQSEAISPIISSHEASTREQAYAQLRTLAKAFSTLEPHSPTASVLEKVAGWEDKQLTQIMNDFSNPSLFVEFLSKNSK